jgi:hypothetical protein
MFPRIISVSLLLTALAMGLSACALDSPDIGPAAESNTVTVAEGLDCVEPSECPDPPVCERGRELVEGPCCQECSRLVLESCGGLWDLAGVCGSGLYCSTLPTMPPVDTEGVCLPLEACDAVFEGYYRHSETGECTLGWHSGCSSPFPYDTLRACEADTGGEFCEDFDYTVCTADGDCGEGRRCDRRDCVSSTCGCDPETGDIFCTADCRLDAGVCVDDAGFCEGFDYTTCDSDEQCGRGRHCELSDCVASRCECDSESGGVFCTEDCGGGAGVCVDGPAGGGPGDACGSRGLVPCRGDLVCAGGYPEVDLPGVCTEPVACRAVERFRAFKRAGRVVGLGFAPSLRGETVAVELGTEVRHVRVNRRGFFVAAARLPAGSHQVLPVGCEGFSRTVRVR